MVIELSACLPDSNQSQENHKITELEVLNTIDTNVSSGNQIQEPDSNSTLVSEPSALDPLSIPNTTPHLTKNLSNPEVLPSPIPSRVSKNGLLPPMTPSNFLNNTNEALTSTPMTFDFESYETLIEPTLTNLMTPKSSETIKTFTTR